MLHWQKYNAYRLAKSKEVKVDDRPKLKTNYDPSSPYSMEYNGVKATFPSENILDKHGLIKDEVEDSFFTGHRYEPIKKDLAHKKKHGWHYDFTDLVDKVHDSGVLPSETLHKIYKESPIQYDMSDFGPLLHLATGSNVNYNHVLNRLLNDVMMYKLVSPITKYLHKESSPEHKELDEKLYDKLIAGQSIGPVTFGVYDVTGENIGNINPFILNDRNNDMSHLLPHMFKNEDSHQTLHHITRFNPFYGPVKHFHTRHLMNQLQEPEDLFYLPKNLLLAKYIFSGMLLPDIVNNLRTPGIEDFDNESIVKAGENLHEQLRNKQKLALTDDPNRYKLVIPKEQSLVKFLEGKYKHTPEHLFKSIHPDTQEMINNLNIDDLDPYYQKYKHPVKKLSDYVFENKNGVSSRFPRLHHLINVTSKVLDTGGPHQLVNNYPLYDFKHSPAEMTNLNNPTLDTDHLNSSPLRKNLNYDVDRVKQFIPLHDLHVDLPKDELRKISKLNYYPHTLEYYTTYKFYDALAKQLRGENEDRQHIDVNKDILQYMPQILPHFYPKSQQEYHDILEANALKLLVDNDMQLHSVKGEYPEISEMLDILHNNIEKYKQKNIP